MSIQRLKAKPPHQFSSGSKLCNSSPSAFFLGTLVFPPNPNLLRIVRREVLSSSSSLTSSKGASDTTPSRTFWIPDGRNRLPVRDEMDPFQVVTFESKLRRGVFENVDEETRVGELPPMSKDLR